LVEGLVQARTPDQVMRHAVILPPSGGHGGGNHANMIGDAGIIGHIKDVNLSHGIGVSDDIGEGQDLVVDD